MKDMKSMKIQKNATQPSPPFMSFVLFMVERTGRAYNEKKRIKTMKDMKSMKIQKNATQPSPPFMSFVLFMVKLSPSQSTKLFNPSFNRFTLKLIRNPCWMSASFM